MIFRNRVRHGRRLLAKASEITEIIRRARLVQGLASVRNLPRGLLSVHNGLMYWRFSMSGKKQALAPTRGVREPFAIEEPVKAAKSAA